MTAKKRASKQAIKNYKKQHRLRRVFFIFIFFMSVVTLASLSYVVGNVVASNVGLSMQIISDEEGSNSEESSGGNIGSEQASAVSGGSGVHSGQGSGSSSAQSLQLPQVTIDAPTVPSSLPTYVDPLTFVLSVANKDRTVPIGGTVVSGGTQTHLPVISDDPPLFYGNVNLPRALVRLVLSSETIGSVVEADNTGAWYWQPSEPVGEGEHLLTMMVFTEDGEAFVGDAQSRFIIDSTINQVGQEQPRPLSIEASVKKLPEVRHVADNVLFDIRVQIAESSKFIQPGEDLTAQIALINFTRRTGEQDVTLYYTVTDEAGNVVLSQSETVAVATQLFLLKNFSTSLAMDPGVYQLQVELPSSEFTAVSTDMFTVGDEPMIAFPGSISTNVTIATQTLIAMLLLFLFIMYFEFRRYDTLGGFLRGLSEDDLKRQGYF